MFRRWMLITLLVMTVLVGLGQSQAVRAGALEAEKYQVFLPDMSDHALKMRSEFGGVAWVDANGNGQRDAGEVALAGVPIEVTSYPVNQGQNPISGSLTFLTDETGSYSVTLFPNYVYVIEAYPDTTQWTATTPTRIEFRSPAAPLAFNVGLKPLTNK